MRVSTMILESGYTRAQLDHFSSKVLEAAFNIHSELGPGLLEKAYEACLEYELTGLGLKVETQAALPFIYNETVLDFGYRVDLVVENSVFVELKSVDHITPLHESQLLTYLKLSGCKVGLLINFNVVKLNEGIKRMVNDF
jgi:GxxExxY protein